MHNLYNSKNDPLLAKITGIMEVNESDRILVDSVNKHFGIASRKALPYERQSEYDRVLAEARGGKTLTEAVQPIQEGVGEYSLKKTGKEIESAEDTGADDDNKRTCYDIHLKGKKVGELEHNSYTGSINGKLHGRNLPDLSGYAGSTQSGPLGKLHRFLKSKTGATWLSRSNLKETTDPEQIQELSKETLKSYMSKAGETLEGSLPPRMNPASERPKEWFRADKRYHGYDAAYKRVYGDVKETTDPEQIQELSKETLKSYMGKVRKRVADNEEPEGKREKGIWDAQKRASGRWNPVDFAPYDANKLKEGVGSWYLSTLLAPMHIAGHVALGALDAGEDAVRWAGRKISGRKNTPTTIDTPSARPKPDQAQLDKWSAEDKASSERLDAIARSARPKPDQAQLDKWSAEDKASSERLDAIARGDHEEYDRLQSLHKQTGLMKETTDPEQIQELKEPTLLSYEKKARKSFKSAKRKGDTKTMDKRREGLTWIMKKKTEYILNNLDGGNKVPLKENEVTLESVLAEIRSKLSETSLLKIMEELPPLPPKTDVAPTAGNVYNGPGYPERNSIFYRPPTPVAADLRTPPPISLARPGVIPGAAATFAAPVGAPVPGRVASRIDLSGNRPVSTTAAATPVTPSPAASSAQTDDAPEVSSTLTPAQRAQYATQSQDRPATVASLAGAVNRGATPAPTPARPMGTTFPGGATGTPDGQRAPTLDPRPAASPAAAAIAANRTMSSDDTPEVSSTLTAAQRAQYAAQAPARPATVAANRGATPAPAAAATPAPTPAIPMGTTFPGGATGTPDGKRAGPLDPRPAASPAAAAIAANRTMSSDDTPEVSSTLTAAQRAQYAAQAPAPTPAAPVDLRRPAPVSLVRPGATQGAPAAIAAPSGAPVPGAVVPRTGQAARPTVSGLAAAVNRTPAATTGPAPTTTPDPARTEPAAATTEPAATAPSAYTVRSGDSLWRIAQRNLPTGSTNAQIQARVNDLYQRNRDVIGSNPDMIRPGQNFQL